MQYCICDLALLFCIQYNGSDTTKWPEVQRHRREIKSPNGSWVVLPKARPKEETTKTMVSWSFILSRGFQNMDWRLDQNFAPVVDNVADAVVVVNVILSTSIRCSRWANKQGIKIWINKEGQTVERPDGCWPVSVVGRLQHWIDFESMPSFKWLDMFALDWVAQWAKVSVKLVGFSWLAPRLERLPSIGGLLSHAPWV